MFSRTVNSLLFSFSWKRITGITFQGTFFSFPHDQPFEILFVDNYDLILLLGRRGRTFSVASDAVTDIKIKYIKNSLRRK